MKKVKEENVLDKECMVSFDVKALFTSIPVNEAVDAVERLLILNDTWRGKTKLSLKNIFRLLEFVLNTTYFVFMNTFYQQNFGCAMGSPCSPIIANIFMEEFEDIALSNTRYAPRVWYRYVDDTYAIIDKESVILFHEHLNSLNEHIQFTVEHQSDTGSLPFLDVLVQRRQDGSITTKVYRKPTHTNQYLDWSSHHPLHQKTGVIHTLSQRAGDISSDNASLKEERELISTAMRNCNYPEWVIKRGLGPPRHRERIQSEQEEETKGWATIPYVKGVSEPISRILRTAGIKVAMKPHNTLRKELVHPKDRDSLMEKAGVVYQVNCKQCDAAYIGQTGRHLYERIKEHRSAVEKGYTRQSGIAEHAYEKHHDIDWDGVQILDQESDHAKRLVCEALHIRISNPSMNRERGVEVPAQLVKLLREGGKSTSVTTSACDVATSLQLARN